VRLRVYAILLAGGGLHVGGLKLREEMAQISESNRLYSQGGKKLHGAAGARQSARKRLNSYRSKRTPPNSIDFRTSACHFCRPMASRGIAPAKMANRAIVGPVFTAAGFRAYYLACFPDSIVVLPQGWTGFWLAVSNFNLPVRGMGSLIANLIYGFGPRLRKRTEAALADTPDSQLRVHTTIPISQICSILFQRGRFFAKTGFPTPSITLETSNGDQRKFGIDIKDFQKACAQLQQMYPERCKSL
jgi:hypothetical protein